MEPDDTKNTQPVVAIVAKPEFALTVIHPFGDYRRGDLIDSADAIAAVLAGENVHHCHKVAPQ